MVTDIRPTSCRANYADAQAEVEEAALAAVAVLGERAEGSEQLLRSSPQLVSEVAAKALGRSGAGDIRSCSGSAHGQHLTVQCSRTHAVVPLS